MGNCLGFSDTTSDTSPAAAKTAAAKTAAAKTTTTTATTNPTKKPKSSSSATAAAATTAANKLHGKKSSSSTSTIHSQIMKEHSLDVYKKYEEIEVLGNGSMGHVAKVQIKKTYDGGSAYVAMGGKAASVGAGAAKDADKAKAFISRAGLAGSLDTAGVNSLQKDTAVGVTSSGSTFSYSSSSSNGGGGGGQNRKGSSNDVGSIITSKTGVNCANTGCYALKSIILDRVSTMFMEELKNEINILKQMDHPNIVKLHEVFSHRKQIYMILELCDGGDLYTRLPYTEKESAYHTGKLLSAIKYMHNHGIVHRDLKFENIMFENKSSAAEIKVIDFGLSKKFATNRLGVMKEGVGTLYSMAPQVLQGVYTSQADMWSVGVITYMLLSSHRPFYNKKRKIMIDRIMRCDYTFKKGYWDPISDEAKDFIDRLLVLDPKVRYRAEKAQEHAWMKKEFKLEDRTDMTASTITRTHTALYRYKNNLGLKKLALNVIAHRSSTAEIFKLRKAFDKFDTANDGVISSEEFKIALKDECSYSDESIREMFDAIDVNQTGDIMYTEFIAATLEAQGQVDEERVAEAFDRLDVDNTGYISKENINEWLHGTDTTMEEIETMISNADVDNCGQVSFAEFLEMFRTEATKEAASLKLSMTELDDNDDSKDGTCKAGASLLSSIKPVNDDFEDDEFGTNTTAVSSTKDSSEEENLVGLDAVIPGGKHDTERS